MLNQGHGRATLAAMGPLLPRAAGYLRHVASARTRHGVHSPFVYRLVNEVLNSDDGPAESELLEALRKEYLQDERPMEVKDLGAGPTIQRGPQRRSSEIARHSLKPARQARMLYRLARWTGAWNALELGTSFGVTSAYIAAGLRGGVLTTVEGSPEIHRVALSTFRRTGNTNITALNGAFRDVLHDLSVAGAQYDLIFMDGHHAEGPTIEYFEQCLRLAHERTAIVIDDHWSAGMERAWARVKARPAVSVTVDLFHCGLVFLHHGQAREHFRLRF